MMMRIFACLIGAALIACSPQSATTPADASTGQPATSSEVLPLDAKHPISGLDIIIAKIDSGEENYGFEVELASTPEAQTRGLMFRTELGDFEGMIFPSEFPIPRSFWMRNTPLPLDLIFIGEDRKIRNIAAMAEPYSLDSIPSDGPVIAVLEIRGGRAAELGIEPGDTVEW
ncbi:DUF192 domain-containing protein [Altererythrobacter sp. MF3-039]|uniref:DUF192 domain-containing protein n=1 Tax=Altererythrobacter sp. MF3-039 TaxID=3252901 RepID=UPI00390CCC15